MRKNKYNYNKTEMLLKSMNDRYVFCPLVDRKIEDIDCVENRDVVDGMIVESSLPEKYKKKKNWKGICKNCLWHEYGY